MSSCCESPVRAIHAIHCDTVVEKSFQQTMIIKSPSREPKSRSTLVLTLIDKINKIVLVTRRGVTNKLN